MGYIKKHASHLEISRVLNYLMHIDMGRIQKKFKQVLVHLKL